MNKNNRPIKNEEGEPITTEPVSNAEHTPQSDAVTGTETLDTGRKIEATTHVNKVGTPNAVETHQAADIANPHDATLKPSAADKVFQADQRRAEMYQMATVTVPIFQSSKLELPPNWDSYLKVYKRYDRSDTPLQIIVYHATEPELLDNTDLSKYGDYTELLSSSITTFRKNTPLIFHTYNPKLLDIMKITAINGVLFADKQTLLPITTELKPGMSVNNRFSNIEAEIGMLCYFVLNNVVKRHEKPTLLPDVTFSEVSQFLTDRSVVLPLGPSLPLAARVLNMQAINEYIALLNEEDYGRYVIGRSGIVERDPAYGYKTGHMEGMNIDHITASLLNLNYFALHGERLTKERIELLIRACSWPGSYIDLPVDQQLVPFFVEQTSILLNCFALCASREPDLHDIILHDFRSYIHSCSLFSVHFDTPFIMPKISSTISAAPIRAELIRMYKRGDASQIEQLLAQEMAPMILIPRFVPIYMQPDDNTAIITIFLYMLMQLLLPNHFWTHCRLIQNEIVRFLTSWYPGEMTNVIDNLGLRITRDEDGNLVRNPRNVTPFQANSAFSDHYPSLFTPMLEEVQQIPNILLIMRHFAILPDGQLGDNIATEAGLPRLLAAPTHYIGLVPEDQITNLLVRINGMAQTCKRLIGAKRTNTSKSDISPITSQIDYIAAMARKVTEAMCATLRLPYLTLMNHPLAVFPNLILQGGYHQNLNWAIFSEGENYGLNNAIRSYVDSRVWDASEFITLLTNTSWNYHDARDDPTGREGAMMVPTFKMPNPVEILTHSMAVYDIMKTLAIPDGVIIYLFTRDDADNRVLDIRERWGIQMRTKVYSQVKGIVQNLLMSKENSLHGLTALTKNFKRDGRLHQPKLRRNTNANVPIDFDPAIDTASMDEPVMEFLNNEEYRRLFIGLDCIQTMRKPSQGLVLFKRHVKTPTHLPLPLFDDYIDIEYIPGVTFRPQWAEGRNFTALRLERDGEVYYESNPYEWGKIRLNCNENIVSNDEIETIIAGINDVGLMVRLQHIMYVAEISTKDLGVSNDFETILRCPTYNYPWIKFFYNPIVIEQSHFSRAHGPRTQCIHPMNDLDIHIATSGLAMSSRDDPALYFTAPRPTEYDTGYLDADGMPMYHTHISKLDLQIPSMSNMVMGLHEPFITDSIELPITVREPQLTIL
ncbi:major capsid protein [Dendrolimus punctatus cypovirus 22]|uniref:major capsid protein n=1 Tax=Dendrolimus punctatus cypovirus 22 TaxID=1577776 RepID=UPI00053F9E9C|nr:major capsid protein [Dendrolimus punctatus cypovirus 22]AIY60597.1 major capsid protein [Dendrolimus punctatus cypovirus 22]